ncbi:MAG: CCA tRNA nucleotidyltransferase [Candidatus Peribacteraceae bacterium]|nr:CCA tRNA nucleotidyltransferase [Candidatus Peribacteraceae bacterium]MDP7477341.1 CCA tRNA nucleotidyltransferase [Candidatus Peribacteraceae bacterium]
MAIAQDIIDRTLSSVQGTQGYNVCSLLLDAGFEAWWVGGCVRDMLRGLIPEDIDIATSARPEDIIKLFAKHDDTAAALGAVVVSLEGQTLEITTFRHEHELSDGRFPESVEFSNKESDVARRDITINAIYFNPISSELSDPFGGEKDLAESLVTFIGNPEVRIGHDALRILRVIRFRALINGQYHPDTYKGLQSECKSVEVLSGTRRLRELEKMLMGPHPEIAFEDLWETGVIEYLIPELHACKGVAQPSSAHEEGDVWDHTMQVISSFTDDHKADARWAALLHDIGKPATFAIDEERIKFNEHASRGADIAKVLLDRLQFSSERRDKICWIIEHHMMMGTFSEIDDVRKAHWYYHPWFIELLQVFWLDVAGTTPSNFDLYESIIKDYNKFLDANPAPKKPLLSGEDIMKALGIEQGEGVGRALKALHEAQVEKQISTKQEALEFLKGL